MNKLSNAAKAKRIPAKPATQRSLRAMQQAALRAAAWQAFTKAIAAHNATLADRTT